MRHGEIAIFGVPDNAGPGVATLDGWLALGVEDVGDDFVGYDGGRFAPGSRGGADESHEAVFGAVAYGVVPHLECAVRGAEYRIVTAKGRCGAKRDGPVMPGDWLGRRAHLLLRRQRGDSDETQGEQICHEYSHDWFLRIWRVQAMAGRCP